MIERNEHGNAALTSPYEEIFQVRIWWIELRFKKWMFSYSFWHIGAKRLKPVSVCSCLSSLLTLNYRLAEV